MNTISKVILSILLIAIIFGVGFIYGKKSVVIDTNTKIEYLPGDTVRDTVKIPIPIESKPIDTISLLTYCINSGLYDYLIPTIVKDSLIYVSVDSTKIVKDWITERKYDIVLFDVDTLGKLTVNPIVQYNQLKDIPYSYIPMQKNITDTKVISRKFEPFIGLGLNTSNEYNIQGGAFIVNGWGASYMYQYNASTKTGSHGINILKKF